MSMEANDVNDSSNLISDDIGVGKDSNETTASLDYYNIGHAVSRWPQVCIGSRSGFNPTGTEF